MSKTAALYARVSSDQQREQNTIASQTQALLDYAQGHQYTVPPEWRFEDEGFSGGTLVRPGLERLRDLISEGTIQTVLIYAPDRLSRNYPYQVLLLEEFARGGAQVVFLNAPAADTPEQRLALQFQGMIAEYERAQIAERCRRGKRHRAKAGLVNVLSSVAPYGYRYVRKSPTAQAYYEVVESQAQVVREIFRLYTVEGQSMSSIARGLNGQQIPTHCRKGAWLSETVHGMLKNSAYQGRAYYGKTQPAPPSVRRTRPARLKGAYAPRSPGKCRRPAEEWIAIPVPALVSAETFALAQERMQLNKALSPRRTQVPSVLQGLLVCEQCGYGLYRANGRPTPAGVRYHYYRCGGLDRHRAEGRVCQARPVPVEHLDQLIWEQVWQLLSQPELVQAEIQRRLQEHRQSSPVEQRRGEVSRELARVQEQTDKLIDAYQEGLMDIKELRGRVSELKKRQGALEKEEQSLSLQAVERDRLLELTTSVERFMEQLKESAQSLDVLQKQRIVRLLVREVVVGQNRVTIHHSVPLSGHGSGQEVPGYRLCQGRYVVTT